MPWAFCMRRSNKIPAYQSYYHDERDAIGTMASYYIAAYAAQLVASRRPDGVEKQRRSKRTEAQLVASRRPDGAEVQQQLR